MANHDFPRFFNIPGLDAQQAYVIFTIMNVISNNKSASIAAIAEKCGVSAMTVSRALRNSEAVKPETRDKILKTAEELGYHRRARVGRTASAPDNVRPAIEVVMGNFGRHTAIFFTELLTSIEQALAEKGFDCIVRTCNGEYRQFNNLLNILQSSAARGTFLIGNFSPDYLQALLEVAPDAVLLDNPGDPSLGLPFQSLGFDNIEAARLGTSHLLGMGRKRILLVRGQKDHYFSRESEQGYRDALSAAGIEVDPALIVEADFTAEGACEVVKNLNVEFDGVFTNDEMACGVYQALHSAGKRIPEDAAVCGCDGLPVGNHLYPPLTSVVLDYKKLGQLAVNHILKNDRKLFTDCRIKLMPKLRRMKS